MGNPRPNTLVRDLGVAVGWAVFVGVGIALGLALGSLGADVPADSGMLSLFGFVAGGGTLIVRLVMVGWKHRGGGRTPPAQGPAKPATAKRAPAKSAAPKQRRPGGESTSSRRT